jgi:hypothetical protein
MRLRDRRGIALALLVSSLLCGTAAVAEAGRFGSRGKRGSQPRRVVRRAILETGDGELQLSRTRVRFPGAKAWEALPSEGKKIFEHSVGNRSVTYEVSRTIRVDSEHVTIRIGDGSGSNARYRLKLELFGEPGTKWWFTRVSELHHMPRFRAAGANQKVDASTIVERERDQLAASIAARPTESNWEVGEAVLASFDGSYFSIGRRLGPNEPLTFNYEPLPQPQPRARRGGRTAAPPAVAAEEEPTLREEGHLVLRVFRKRIRE